jgi:Histidine kinase
LVKTAHKTILTHIFFVTLFLVIPTIAFIRMPGEPAFSLTRVFVQDTTANFVLLCFFYFNYYLLLPTFFFNKKYVQYILYMVLFLSVALMLPFFTGKFFTNIQPYMPLPNAPKHSIGLNHPQPPSIISFVFNEFRRHLSLFFSAIFFSFLLKTREHVSQLKEEKLKAELSTLKAQINPHFLFNTLNSIYALSVKKDDRAADAIIHLSGLMRYVTKDANDYEIPINKELVYITNYVELQKARLGSTAIIYFENYNPISSLHIAPLILITYIENAFKYGINPNVQQSIIDIKIELHQGTLQLFVHNKKLQIANGVASTGIGMANTNERLQHLYPGKHQIQIFEDDENYSIKLIITLT